VSTPNARPRIQFKTLISDPTLLELLRSHHTIVFYSRGLDGSITNASNAALSLLDQYGIDVHKIAVARNTPLESELQNYSGWQYFPQLYVMSEFIGGNVVLPEFFHSGEYLRVLSQGGFSSSEKTIQKSDLTQQMASAIWKLSLSQSQNDLAVAKSDGSIEIINTESRLLRLRLESHRGWVNAVRFDPIGERLYSGGSDAVLRKWDATGGAAMDSAFDHTRWINDIAVDPSSKSVASVGADRIIRIWTRNLQPISQCSPHNANIWSALAIDNALVSGDEDGVVVVTELANLNQIAQYRAHRNCITTISPAIEPATFCTAGYDGMVFGWNIRGQLLFKYDGHPERVWTVCPILDGNAVASGCADGSVDIWEPRRGHQLRKFMFRAQPLAMTYIPRTKTLAVGLSDGTLKWLDLR